MKILVINAWSSSLKYQLIDMEQKTVIAKWNVQHIWENGSEIKNHTEALHSILPNVSENGKLEFDAIGHRVVHGGEYFKNPVIITDEVVARIEECSDLAPLHNPANLQAILACKALLPEIPQVGVFDTAFHQTMEAAHYLYPLPMQYYEKYKIRRYGFHGTSHQYVYEQLIKNSEFRMQKESSKVITCHIGNGASISAIKDGKVIETSMGMTPLEGVMMWTRSGNIDSAIIPYLMKNEWLTVDQVMTILNKESWMLWVSWISNDMRDVFEWLDAWNERCRLALDMYVNSLIKYIWSYIAVLWWVDAIVLTGWVVEHQALIRSLLMEKFTWLWIALDETLNKDELPNGAIISTADSKVKVVVIPTNEELMIAEETFKII